MKEGADVYITTYRPSKGLFEAAVKDVSFQPITESAAGLTGSKRVCIDYGQGFPPFRAIRKPVARPGDPEALRARMQGEGTR